MPTAECPTVPPETVTVLVVGRFHRSMPRSKVPPALPTVLPLTLTVEPTWTDFHVAYRVGARHSLELGAAGKAIAAGNRTGDIFNPNEANARKVGTKEMGDAIAAAG